MSRYFLYCPSTFGVDDAQNCLRAGRYIFHLLLFYGLEKKVHRGQWLI